MRPPTGSYTFTSSGQTATPVTVTEGPPPKLTWGDDPGVDFSWNTDGYWERWIEGQGWELLRIDEPAPPDYFKTTLGIEVEHGTYSSP